MSREAVLSLLDLEDDEEPLHEESRGISSEPTQELSAASNSALDIQSNGQHTPESQEIMNQPLYELYTSSESEYYIENNDQQTTEMQQIMPQPTYESYLFLNSPYPLDQ